MVVFRREYEGGTHNGHTGAGGATWYSAADYDQHVGGTVQQRCAGR